MYTIGASQETFETVNPVHSDMDFANNQPDLGLASVGLTEPLIVKVKPSSCYRGPPEMKVNLSELTCFLISYQMNIFSRIHIQ